jgi:hypothetical protein
LAATAPTAADSILREHLPWQAKRNPERIDAVNKDIEEFRSSNWDPPLE